MWGSYRTTPRFSTESEDSNYSRDRSLGTTPSLEHQFWAEDHPVFGNMDDQPPPPYEPQILGQGQGAFRPVTPQQVPGPGNPQPANELQEVRQILHGILAVQQNNQRENIELMARFREVGRNVEQLAQSVDKIDTPLAVTQSVTVLQRSR